MDRIRPYLGTELIKIISGQRRVGKSFLMLGLRRWFEENEPDAEILYINKELHEFHSIQTWEDLLEYRLRRVEPGRRSVLLIDEVQEIEEFERALRSLQAEGGTEIVCTGSNSRLLSGDLATLLTGRCLKTTVYGLVYAEFLRFHGLARSNEALTAYLRFGGMPYLHNLDLVEDVAFEYLREVADSILLRDVVGRFGVRRVDFLRRLALFLADNVGSMVSARSISKYLKSQRVSIGHKVVLDYISHLSSAFMVYGLRRAEITGRKIFEVGEKYYYGDLGIRNSMVGFRSTDIGSLLENAVFLHLAAAGYDVQVGTMDGREIDFVCQRRGERTYVQVAYLISNEEVRDREFGNLLRIPDNYPKYVVSMDEGAGGSYRGIRHIHAEDLLHSLSVGSKSGELHPG